MRSFWCLYFLGKYLFVQKLAGMLYFSNFQCLIFVRSHLPLPGPTTMWTRWVGTTKLWSVAQIPPMLPPESKRVHFCRSVSTLRVLSLPPIGQSDWDDLAPLTQQDAHKSSLQDAFFRAGRSNNHVVLSLHPSPSYSPRYSHYGISSTSLGKSMKHR